ncbi:MAG: formate dehydrogenase, partial [Pseudomonadales bacterium]|nr:formate dehydrogenase [Pseudomonadales bacterium]
MTAVVYVPRDAAALALGAEEVAQAIRAAALGHSIDVQIKRNGSRGLYWLEPLVEVECAAGRVAYGPVSAADVPSLFKSGFLAGGAHALSFGVTEQIPYLQRQRRETFERVGIVDPVAVDDYVRRGGYDGLKRALALTPAGIVQCIKDSGLRGRGGAAFPTGIKWQTALDTPATQKYVACNADEGDSGTYADRMLMEGDPFSLLEGMTIAGLAVGATRGYIYLRAEYPHAHRVLLDAIANARAGNYLGSSVLGSGRAFDIEIRLGAGAYICGEETSMLESL